MKHSNWGLWRLNEHESNSVLSWLQIWTSPPPDWMDALAPPSLQLSAWKETSLVSLQARFCISPRFTASLQVMGSVKCRAAVSIKPLQVCFCFLCPLIDSFGCTFRSLLSMSNTPGYKTNQETGGHTECQMAPALPQPQSTRTAWRMRTAVSDEESAGFVRPAAL